MTTLAATAPQTTAQSPLAAAYTRALARAAAAKLVAYRTDDANLFEVPSVSDPSAQPHIVRVVGARWQHLVCNCRGGNQVSCMHRAVVAFGRQHGVFAVRPVKEVAAPAAPLATWVDPAAAVAEATRFVQDLFEDTAPVVEPAPVVATGWDKTTLDPRAAAYALLPGVYTVTAPCGTYRTFKLAVWSEGKGDEKTATTTLVASFLSGSDNTADYTGFAFVKPSGQVHVWKRFANESTAVDLLRKLVAHSPEVSIETAAHCFVCGRLLTTPESLALGIGPVCAEKGGAHTTTPAIGAGSSAWQLAPEFRVRAPGADALANCVHGMAHDECCLLCAEAETVANSLADQAAVIREMGGVPSEALESLVVAQANAVAVAAHILEGTRVASTFDFYA